MGLILTARRANCCWPVSAFHVCVWCEHVRPVSAFHMCAWGGHARPVSAFHVCVWCGHARQESTDVLMCGQQRTMFRGCFLPSVRQGFSCCFPLCCMLQANWPRRIVRTWEVQVEDSCLVSLRETGLDLPLSTHVVQVWTPVIRPAWTHAFTQWAIFLAPNTASNPLYKV